MIIFRKLRSTARLYSNRPGAVLRKGFNMLEHSARDECSFFIKNSQAHEGGFVNRAHECDIYYTLFGFILSSSLKISIDRKALKNFIESFEINSCRSRADALSLAILKNRAIKKKTESLKIMNLANSEDSPFKPVNDIYTLFLEIIAMLYISSSVIPGNSMSIRNIQETFDPESKDKAVTPNLAAALVIVRLMETGFITADRKNMPENSKFIESLILSRMRKDGGFAVSPFINLSDLLTTSVSLYALRLCNHDISITRPENMEYIASLYRNGSFSASSDDDQKDIEYLFYGLMALGSLSI